MGKIRQHKLLTIAIALVSFGVIAAPVWVEVGGVVTLPALITTGTQTAATQACTGSPCSTNTTATQSMLLNSDTNDATTSTTVGAITLKASVNVTDGDLLLDVQNSAAGHAFTVNEQGAAVALSTLSCAGATSTIASGSNAFGAATNGSRIDFGAGASDYASSDGTTVTFAGAVTASGAITGNAGVSTGGSTMNSNTLQSVTATTMTYRSDIADGSSAIGHKFSNFTNLTTAGAKTAVFYTNNFGTEQAAVMNTGFFIQPAQTATIADNGNGGTAPATTITPTSNVILMAYNDPQSASVGTISETGAQPGEVIYIAHTGSGGSVVFTEVAGQQEIGGTACTLNLSDTAEAVYMNSSWHFLVCRDN